MFSVKKNSPGFHQQLNTKDARDFQWYQHQWKRDMRNRTPWSSKKKKKKNQLGFEIGLPVNDMSTIILKQASK